MRALARWTLGLGVLLLAGCTVVVSPFGRPDTGLHETTIEGKGPAKILWLPISGFISDTPDSSAFGLVSRASTLTRVTQALDKAEHDDEIAALVLRIESPGGTVAAADEIYARIRRYHEATGVPVIASLGGLAASGGYYVAMAADTVVAQPTTITGSIGVIIFDINAAGLMDKLGLDDQTYTSGAHKDLLSPLRKPSDGEPAIVQRVVDQLFARFVAVVKRSRTHLDTDRLDTITDGRIFAAEDAKRLGLVDRIGHLDSVLASARKAAGVEHARVIRYYRGASAPPTLSARAAAVPPAAPQADLSLAALQARLAQRGGPQAMYLWRGALLR